jgi:hypothetical protein
MLSAKGASHPSEELIFKTTEAQRRLLVIDGFVIPSVTPGFAAYRS